MDGSIEWDDPTEGDGGFPRVDRNRIQEVLSYDSTGALLIKLHNILLSELIETVALMDSKYRSGDLNEVQKLAHRLKSTCNSAGACLVGEILRRIEDAILKNNAPSEELEELMTRFKAEVPKTVTEIQLLGLDILNQKTAEL